MCAEERGAPSKADRAALLSRWLDLPQLLDLCALYGASCSGTSSSQLSQLVGAALQLLPRLGSQGAQAGPHIAQNLGQVAEACMAAAGKAGKEAAMLQSLLGGWTC